MSGNFFKHETYKCPSCKELYRRLVIDNKQAVCPTCLNAEWLKDEDDETSI